MKYTDIQGMQKEAVTWGNVGKGAAKFLGDAALYIPKGIYNTARRATHRHPLGTLALLGTGAAGTVNYFRAPDSKLDAGSGKQLPLGFWDKLFYRVPENVGKGVAKGKELVGQTMDAVGDALNTPGQQYLTTTKFEWPYVASTLNPLSSVFGTTDWVPEKAENMFVTKEMKEGSPEEANAKRMGHMTFKTGAIGLLAAALIGGYRGLTHVDEMMDLKTSDRPGKGLSSQLSTTFSGELAGKKKRKKKKAQKKTAAAERDKNFTVNNALSAAIPTGALILAGALAYRGVDNTMDQVRDHQLQKAINAKENALKNLITTRARVAKGLANDREVNAALRPLTGEDIYVKEAAQVKEAAGVPGVDKAVAGVGLVSAAIVLASAMGMYSYTKASDPNNIKYKAYKDALRVYAKNRSGMTPITITPSDAENYFAGIDKDQEAPTTARKQPVLDTDSLTRPISVSF